MRQPNRPFVVRIVRDYKRLSDAHMTDLPKPRVVGTYSTRARAEDVVTTPYAIKRGAYVEGPS